MATPLQFRDAALDAEIALSSERDVRRSAERGKTESQATDDELS